MGDTGWLLFIKCSREEVVTYLDARKAQGFNVIQVMVVHDLKKDKNVYGDSAFVNQDAASPKTTPGNNPANKEAYDYWDHVEFVIDEAAKRNMYIGMVAIWGSNIKSKWINEKQAAAYAGFLAQRFANKPNIIWINGGDLKGDVGMEVWNTLGNTFYQKDPSHLTSFHPRGRYSSSVWFHDKAWLSFNMVQSGHKNYRQDTSAADQFHFGEDNWRFISRDHALLPVKPTLDAEPSYENIPHGLHDSLETRWTAADLRRYAYWSVFAGAAGFTYGENSVMQFYTAAEGAGAYGVTNDWKKGLQSPGAMQMQFLKKLILSKDQLARVPDEGLVNNQGSRYDHLAATRGNDYAFIYTYTGRKISANLGRCKGSKVKCSWYNPRNGKYQLIGTIENKGIKIFTAPGIEKNGNDWVLVIESVL